MNEEQLVDAAYAFVTDPRASRTGRALVEEWPGIIPCSRAWCSTASKIGGT